MKNLSEMSVLDFTDKEEKDFKKQLRKESSEIYRQQRDALKSIKDYPKNNLLSYPCGCIGPQNGEPLCPCKMRRVIIRNGRYVQKEVDLGPADFPTKGDNFTTEFKFIPGEVIE